jgi:hypothetical protein
MTKWGEVFSMSNDQNPGCLRTIEWIIPWVVVPWIVFSYKYFFIFLIFFKEVNHALGCCPLNCFFLQVFFYFFYFFKEVTAWVCPGPQGIASRPLTKWGGVFSMQNDHSPGCPRTIEWIMPRVVVPWIVFSYKLFFFRLQPGSAQDLKNTAWVCPGPEKY